MFKGQDNSNVTENLLLKPYKSNPMSKGSSRMSDFNCWIYKLGHAGPLVVQNIIIKTDS